MESHLIRSWAHAPWHSWLKEDAQWLDLFAELWSRLPDVAVKALLAQPKSLIILPPVRASRVVRVEASLPKGAWLLQLDEALLSRPKEEALAILAHEFAHLICPVTEDAHTNDLEADHLAIEWGFGEGLAQALTRDLGRQGRA